MACGSNDCKYTCTKDKLGFYQGVVNSAATVGKMFGPVVGGAIVDLYNMEVLFIAIMVMLVVALIATSIYDKRVKVEETVEEKLQFSLTEHVTCFRIYLNKTTFRTREIARLS